MFIPSWIPVDFSSSLSKAYIKFIVAYTELQIDIIAMSFVNTRQQRRKVLYSLHITGLLNDSMRISIPALI